MDGKAEALEFIVREDFAMQNVSLKDLKLKPGILIAGILRNRMPIVPSGKDFITAGDKVVVLASGIKLNDLSEVVE
jgi:trk system potassium uptake protein TrkA